MSRKQKFGVVVFPGSNCDQDAFYVLRDILKQPTCYLWHKQSSLEDSDVIILPGGFSFGDYLRCGAIARFSPIMKEVVRFASQGGTVIGICNGFQILCESGLLPGSLLRNRDLAFICDTVFLRTEHSSSRFTSECKPGEILRIPIAHGEGNYFADDETVERLNENGQVLFRYCGVSGNVSDETNPNGSIQNIAGIMNRAGNVMGMMPHPERAAESILGSTDGLKIFLSLIHDDPGHHPISEPLVLERTSLWAD